MCLILFAYNVHPRYRLVLAANRDEYYSRPTAPVDFWPDHPHVLAGRDLQQMGTWMGVTRTGRLAAVTNFRDPRALKNGAPSRGGLVSGFLLDRGSPGDYLRRIASAADQYNGFNLLVGDRHELLYFSNHEKKIRTVEPGIHGLSNHLLDTPWPKVALGKEKLARCLAGPEAVGADPFLQLLENQMTAAPDRLPQTGVPPEWERVLSPLFITSPDYGTRSSSVVLIDREGAIHFSERTWQPAQARPVEHFTRSFELPP